MRNYLQPTLQWWQQHLAIATQNNYYHNPTLVVAIGTHTCNHLFHRGISAYLWQRSLWQTQYTILVAIRPTYRYQLWHWLPWNPILQPNMWCCENKWSYKGQILVVISNKLFICTTMTHFFIDGYPTTLDSSWCIYCNSLNGFYLPCYLTNFYSVTWHLWVFHVTHATIIFVATLPHLLFMVPIFGIFQMPSTCIVHNS